MQGAATPFGRYLLVEEMATGAPGGVAAAAFRAVMRVGELERTVVLKQLVPERLDGKWRERARAIAGIAHMNVAALVDHGVVDGVPFVAHELVDGADLGALCELGMRAGRPLPPVLAAWIVAEAARGLLFAHARAERGRPLGLLHRNIAPRNVLLSHDGDVKLVDFALVPPRASQWPLSRLRYASPEQIAGEPLDGRSDVYSLGAVLYEALAGQPLVTAGDEDEARRQIEAGRWRPPSAQSVAAEVALDAVVMRALAKDRDARPDAAGLLRELSQFLDENQGAAGRDALAPLLHAVLPPRRDVAARPDEAELYEEGEAAAPRSAPRSVEARRPSVPAAASVPARGAAARRTRIALASVALAIAGALGGLLAWREHRAAASARVTSATGASLVMGAPDEEAAGCPLLHVGSAEEMHRRLVVEAIDAALCATPPGRAEPVFPSEIMTHLAAHHLVAETSAAARGALTGEVAPALAAKPI